MKPIDMVYCWCDGNDPAFKDRRRFYLAKENGVYDRDSIGNHRFIDNEELKYSLRSLELYAPWINHIYIVTDRQIPKWLDLNNKRVTIIDHSEIMPREIIPCFNSVVIERYIVNIPGLSEFFLYGNDDMFFGRPISPNFFFLPDGKPIVYVKYFEKFSYIKDETDFWEKYQTASSWMQTNLNAWKLLFDRYKKHEFFVSTHTVDGYRKSLFNNTISRYKNDEHFSATNRFRNPRDISRYIFNLDMVYSNQATLSLVEPPGFLEKHIYKKRGYSWKCYCGSEDKKTRKQILRFEPYLFCINAKSGSDEKNKKEMRDFYEFLFPKPSSFERSL